MLMVDNGDWLIQLTQHVSKFELVFFDWLRAQMVNNAWLMVDNAWLMVDTGNSWFNGCLLEQVDSNG